MKNGVKISSTISLQRGKFYFLKFYLLSQREHYMINVQWLKRISFFPRAHVLSLQKISLEMKRFKQKKKIQLGKIIYIKSFLFRLFNSPSFSSFSFYCFCCSLRRSKKKKSYSHKMRKCERRKRISFSQWNERHLHESKSLHLC